MKYIWLAVLLAITMVWHCSENPVFLEKAPVEDNTLADSLVIDTLYATFDTTYYLGRDASTRTSFRMLVGSYSGFTMRPIMKFLTLPLNARILEAWVNFYSVGVMGDTSQAFTVTAYPIKQDWNSNTDSVWADYQANVDYDHPLGSMIITPGLDDTLTFSFSDTSFLNLWADSAGSLQNYGFIFDFSSATFIKEFHSLNSVRPPRLHMRFILPGDTTVTEDSVLVSATAFLFENNYTPEPGRDYVMTLTPHVTVLDFPLQELAAQYPSGIVINSANLQLPIDWDHSLLHPDFGVDLHIVRLRSELTNDTVAVDSNFIVNAIYSIELNRLTADSSFVEVPNNSERRDFAQIFFQNQLLNPETMTGLYVGFRNYIDYLSYFALYKRDNTDPVRRPRLIVAYWIPPAPRF